MAFNRYVIAEVSNHMKWEYPVYNMSSKSWSLTTDREETCYYTEDKLDEAGNDYEALSEQFPTYEFSIEYVGKW